jgi:signal transduction histidine kinase
VNSTSGPPSPERRRVEALLEPLPLAAAALALAWLAFLAASRGSPLAWVLGAVATGIAAFAVQRGRRLRQLLRVRQEELSRAVAAAADRNRELDLLRGLAQSLLSARSTEELFAEVAHAAPGLVRASGGAVMIRAGTEDFLQVAAGHGDLAGAVGRLLPLEGSLAGWVVTEGRPLRTDDMAGDPRNHPVPGLTVELRSALVVPLRSRGEVVGAVTVCNRVDGTPFTEYDTRLLEALGNQLAVGLDRAALLEDTHRNEQVLAEKNRELVEATELKSRFLANMSHELRTPLNAIIGFSDLILAGDEPLSETQRDFLESIARNGRHLLGLINAVLDVSRLEAGRMPVRLARFDLRDALMGAAADTESLRTLKGQACELELGDAPLGVLADQQQIRQVMLNLLSNASKFTEEGGTIRVAAVRTELPLPVPASRAGDVGGLEVREAVWVAVRDTGIGISPEDQARLFQAFSQVDSSARRQQQGTGLGLALAKQLVELHGGTIGVDSVVGTGSTFWFILPVEGPIRRPAEAA